MAKKAKRTRGDNVSKFDLDKFLSRNKEAASEGLEKAKANKGGFAEYDDGRYRLRLIGAEVSGSGSSKHVGFVGRWKILDGDYKGQTYRSWRGITDDRGKIDADKFGWFLGDIRRLGYDVDEIDVDDLGDLMTTLKKDKPTIVGQLKTKGDYQNLNILKLVDEDDEEDEDEDDDDRKKKKKSKSKKDDDEDDDDEDEEEEDEEEEKPKRKKKVAKKSKSKKDDDDEDEEEDDEEEEEEKPKRKKKTSKKKKDEDEEDEDEEDEDDEEEEKPKRKKKSKKDDDDEDEEDEDDDDDDGEEVAVTVGSIAKVKLKTGTEKCEVVEVLEEDDAIKVKTEAGKVVKVGSDKILDIEPPKKKRRKK